MLIDLIYPYKTNKWISQDDIAIIGSAYDVDDYFLEKLDLLQKFSEVVDEVSFLAILNELNGCFAVIISKRHFKAAAVDRIRSFPILYQIKNQELIFVTDPNHIEQGHFNQNAILSFRNCWCVIGNDTLLDNIYQLQAGQYICHIETNVIFPKFYFHHFVRQKFSQFEVKEAANVMDKVFNRLKNQLEGKFLLIPLSGGYDSRLIIAKLVDNGYKNILAYTYGKRNSHEVLIAQKVCEELNVEWQFIPYDKDIFNEFFTENWANYSENNHFYSGLPHEQDFFALNYLKVNNLLPENFIAIPGFCGDLLGGSITAYQPNNFSLTGWINHIQNRHFQGADIQFETDIGFEIANETDFYDSYQHWFVCNKVSKFIVNAVRVYEYFGGTWVLPFWDKELMNFWYAIPYRDRFKQKFYNKVLFTQYFEPLNIAFKKPDYDDNYPNQFKETIKKVIPKQLKDKLIKFKKTVRKEDVNNLLLLNNFIQKEIKETVNGVEVNNSHAIYFLENLNL